MRRPLSWPTDAPKAASRNSSNRDLAASALNRMQDESDELPPDGRDW